MKFNFKKISAIVASTLMAGMTLGVAAAANFPAPFISGGTANVAIVYGTGAGVSSLDLVQAGNIQSNLQSRMGSTSSGSSTDSDQQKSLMTSARKLYYGDAINAPIASLSASELPNMLEDGTFTDLLGTQYDYTQTVTVGDIVSAFSTSSGDLDDPVMLLNVGTDAKDGLYNYTLSFTKNVNVSDSTNVQGQKIKILGVEYVIGASSTNSTLYLYGSGETVSLLGGESSTVNIAGTDHTVELITTTGTTTARLSVDGVSKDVVEGSSYAFSGDINVYVKSITNPQFENDLREVELIMGANTLKLVDGQTVKEGADQTSIKGTYATISGVEGNKISAIKVSVALPKSSADHIALGESFTDPVFGGLKVKLVSVNPELDSTARARIVADTDNNQFAYVTFTSARAGTAGEQRLTYTYDNNTASSAVSPMLAHQVLPSNSKGLIHVLEGENAKEGDWIIVNQGDAGTILEVDDISIDTSTAGTVTFTDAITGDSQTITLTNSSDVTANIYNKSGVNFFGGTGYLITAAGDETTVNIVWDGTTATTLFPRIKLANGGWMAFLTATNVTSGLTYILPDGATTIDSTGAAYTISATATTNNGTFSSAAGMTWNWTNDTAGSMLFDGLATSPSSVCNFNSSSGYGPAILYMEPKKWNDGTYGNWMCIPLTTSGSTEIAIAQPKFNSTNSGFVTLTSDTYVTQAIDEYGALVSFESRTNENGRATIAIPSSQMYLDVVFAEDSATIATGGDTTSGTTSLGDVLVKDSEVGNVATKNLIVVGGSCINSAAATLIGGAKCGPAWYETTGVGSGQFLIKGYATSSITSKLALLVAGYDAADTVNAATYLRTKTVDTGKEYLGTSATSATLVVE